MDASIDISTDSAASGPAPGDPIKPLYPYIMARALVWSGGICDRRTAPGPAKLYSPGVMRSGYTRQDPLKCSRPTSYHTSSFDHKISTTSTVTSQLHLIAKMKVAYLLGPWTFGIGHSIRHWTFDIGPCTLYLGYSTLGIGHWTLYLVPWTLDLGPCTLDIQHGILDFIP